MKLNGIYHDMVMCDVKEIEARVMAVAIRISGKVVAVVENGRSGLEMYMKRKCRRENAGKREDFRG